MLKSTSSSKIQSLLGPNFDKFFLFLDFFTKSYAQISLPEQWNYMVHG
jgi:hypothetical protein